MLADADGRHAPSECFCEVGGNPPIPRPHLPSYLLKGSRLLTIVGPLLLPELKRNGPGEADSHPADPEPVLWSRFQGSRR